MAIADRRTEPLIALLHEAAQLEHCLLDTYLYAACSCKTLPAEFATLADGRENRRRAIQFERVRAWKQAILNVAHEEMLHLHYVQCLIRALGAPPYLGLPPRVGGEWTIADWRERVNGNGNGDGTRVPVEPLSARAVRRFVGYESTDSLQDEDLFGQHAMDLFRRLHAFEADVRLEQVFFDVSDEAEREQLKAALGKLYTDVAPADAVQARAAVMETQEAADVRFQSIADLYTRAILPLYKDAFHHHQVTQTNLDLEGELQNPNYAQEGFLPILPIHRDKNYAAAANTRVQTPMSHYRQVDDVVREIVEEGEGQQAFEQGAEALLERFGSHGGARAYLEALAHDATSAKPTPDWLQRFQDIRESHLYRFAVTMIDLDDEIELARAAGTEFNPARSAQTAPAFADLAEELPAQFNSAYLALLMWLGRIYETKTWDSDTRRRMGIEMLAAWPMMSMAIRPFLELASFLPVDARAALPRRGHRAPRRADARPRAARALRRAGALAGDQRRDGLLRAAGAERRRDLGARPARARGTPRRCRRARTRGDPRAPAGALDAERVRAPVPVPRARRLLRSRARPGLPDAPHAWHALRGERHLRGGRVDEPGIPGRLRPACPLRGPPVGPARDRPGPSGRRGGLPGHAHAARGGRRRAPVRPRAGLATGVRRAGQRHRARAARSAAAAWCARDGARRPRGRGRRRAERLPGDRQCELDGRGAGPGAAGEACRERFELGRSARHRRPARVAATRRAWPDAVPQRPEPPRLPGRRADRSVHRRPAARRRRPDLSARDLQRGQAATADVAAAAAVLATPAVRLRG